MNVDVGSLIAQHHSRPHGPNQASAVFTKHIRAPIESVWEIVRRFDQPQHYKKFIRSCQMLTPGALRVGSARKVRIVSDVAGGAESSSEILHTFDETNYHLGFEVLGGENRLRGYNSLTTLHADEIDGKAATLVIESYFCNVPGNSNLEDTKHVVENIVTFNLDQLAQACERRVSTRSHSQV
ncbi:hypothetical protein L7F22_046326 [Adiantum nelumboides]|nr:hypothetical protein [Adiantum nelumboides]MCO5592325.1 hypothetical protein [Adiantum nelumboides]